MKVVAGSFVSLIALVCAQTSGQSVKVTFYHISLEEWNENGYTSTFQGLMASEANHYCYYDIQLCGLNEWLPQSIFNPSLVMLMDGYPAKVKSNIVLEFKVQMNETMNITNPAQTHLSADVVRAILKTSRYALKVITESWIIYIDGEHLSPPPDYTANRVIIPISCAVLLILIIVTVCLHYWRKRKDHTEQKMDMKLHMGHGTSRVSPNHVPSVGYADGNTKANQLGTIFPPSRQQRIVDPNSSLHTATPSNISMVTDVPDAAKYSNEVSEKEKRKHHKRRHRKKKHREGETTEEHENEPNYSYKKFAETNREANNGFGVTETRENKEIIEMRRNYDLL